MNYTEEQQKDFAERSQAFLKEFNDFYATLKEKHQCQLVYGVVTVPGPQGIHGLTVNESVGDLKFAPKPSPAEFIAKDDASS